MSRFDPSTPIAQEVIALIDALFEDRASPDQAARLQELVVGRPEIARLYVGYTHFWCALPLHVVPSTMRAEHLVELPIDADEAKPRSLSDAMILPALHEEVSTDEPPIVLPVSSAAATLIPQRASSAPTWWRSSRFRTAAIIALPILIGIALWSVLRPAKHSGSLVASAAAVWEDSAHAPSVGAALPPGSASLASGVVQVRLENGVSLIFEGPARFEIKSPAAVTLGLGKLTVSVPSNAHGFTVETPAARTVDLGTEFGVLVDRSGNTETHVIRGTVEMTPITGGAAMRLTADNAARVNYGASGTQKINCQKGNFVQEIPAIDLADVVAGGDGTQRRRNSGIDVEDGSAQLPSDDGGDPEDSPSRREVTGDGEFHPCPNRPLIGGVFVPHGGATPDTLDPAGHGFNFPATENRTYLDLWSGSFWRSARARGATSAVMGSVDYSGSGHGLVVLHANKGVAFDLDALRNAHPDRPFSHLQAVCGNLTAADRPLGVVSDRSEFWVFVDGQLRLHKLIHRTDPPFNVDVPIEAAAHYLTLVATDGGDKYDWDWVTLGDPRLK